MSNISTLSFSKTRLTYLTNFDELGKIYDFPMLVYITQSRKADPLLSLTRQWWIWGRLCLFFLFTGFFFLRCAWQSEYAWRWFGQTAGVWLYVLWKLRTVLPQNHRKQSSLLFPTLGIGTHITIVRGLLIGALAGFLFLPLSQHSWLRWVPGILYLFAISADYLDGYLARITDHETCLGTSLDMHTDALGLLIAPLLAVTLGQLPMFYLSAGIAYYGLNVGKKVRHLQGKPVFPVPPWPGARMLAGFQMGLVGAALLPIFSPSVLTVAAAIFLLPFLLGFVKDWLISCGRIDPYSSTWKQQKQRINRFLLGYLPVVLRGFLLIPGVAALQGEIGHDGVLLIALSLLLLGFLGRLTSLVMSVWLGLMLSPCTPLADWLLFCEVVVLMLSGTGPFSLWQPEERFLFTRAGEQEQ